MDTTQLYIYFFRKTPNMELKRMQIVCVYIE